MNDIAMVLRTIERMAGDSALGERADIALLAREGLALVPTEDGGWTDWHGAGCAPVPLDDLVEVVTRPGSLLLAQPARNIRWRHARISESPTADIVKWRRARP